MMRASPWIQTPIIGNLRTEAFLITRSRVSFPRQLRCCEAESGRVHNTLMIRDTPTPHCESLVKEHGNVLVDAVESFPNLPGKETPRRASQTSSYRSSKKLRAMAIISEIDSGGKIPPNILYFLELGMDIDQIKSMTNRHPDFVYYSLEGKIKPMVKFFLEVGVNPSDIPSILRRRPSLCGISLSENLSPTMSYLESLGVDKKKWAKVIYRFPALLTYSRQKMKATVDYFYELGLTSERVGKVLTGFPSIVGLSVEENIRPKGEYFLEKGYTIEEVGTMFSKFASLLCYSLPANLIPKCEFFLTMHYPMSELVKFPQYFGYSLENRIKPRYAMLMESGVKMSLPQVLTVSELEFEEVLKSRVEKKLDGLVDSNMEGLKL